MPRSRALDIPVVGSDPEGAHERSTAPAARGSAATVFSQPLTPILTACGVAILVLLAISTARSIDLIVALWAANGLALGVWLRHPRGDLSFDLAFGGLMAMGITVGEFLAGNPPWLSLMFTVLNMVEIVGALALARRFAPSLSLSSVEGAWRFMLSTAVIAPIPSAILSAAFLFFVRDAPILMTFQTWWFGHVLGLAVIAPMILAINRNTLLILQRPWKMLEWVALLGSLGLACYLIYFRFSNPVGFLIVPLLIIIAARLRVPGITVAMVVVSVFAVAAVLSGNGPVSVVQIDIPERVLMVQLMLLLGCLPIVLVASLLDERDSLSEKSRLGLVRAERASEAKSRLLANVAHEIKSPVAGIIGIGELWSGGQLGQVNATQKEMADMLVKTARQVETLAHDLLDVARAESGSVKVELRPTDVVGVLEDVCRATILRPDAQGLKIEVEAGGVGLVALADSQRLTQVIDNLATNAVKYGRAGGAITFRAQRVPSGIRIEVRDRGPGLTPEKQGQLFEPFNRLGLERSTVEGHGIGLALAKRLVELQGGAIGVESMPGQGATFWVELPSA